MPDLTELADTELVAAMNTARDDCAEAANTEPNSEWHEACFAACFLYGQEILRRGLDLRTLN